MRAVACEVLGGASAPRRRIHGLGLESARGTSDLELRLAALARARAPLRRALGRIAGQLVTVRAWERLGFARLADYARERAGLSARQLQDLAHVDRRLAELPMVDAALRSGALPWSKARLLARVAEASDEARWLAFARTVSVRALEREVRAIDRGALEAGALELDEDGGAADEKEWVTVHCTGRVRAKFHRARWVARRVAGEDLPPWACMEAVAAEAFSALGVGAGDDAREGGAGSDVADGARADEAIEAAPDLSWPGAGEGDASPRRLRAAEATANVCARQGSGREVISDACTCHDPAREPPANVCARHGSAQGVPELEALLRDLADADAFELDARLRRAVALEQRADAVLAPLLLRAFDARLHRRAGLPSFDAFARERLSLSPRKARALLRLERAATACPTLREAFGAGRLSWVQAQVLLPMLLLPEAKPFRAPWVARAEATTVRRLEECVEGALLLLSTDRDAFLAGGGLAGRPTCAQSTAAAMTGAGVAPVDAPAAEPRGLLPDTLAGPLAEVPTTDAGASETERFMFLAPRDVARLFRAVLCSVRRGLERAAGGPVSRGRAAEWMLDHALDAWGADEPRTKREHRVFARDGWRCTVPGCTSYRNLHDHHIRFRSAGGSDELANRTTLCAFHHLRGIHAGRVRCRGEAPYGLRFELGLRPGRPPLVAYGPGERLASRSADAA